MDIVRILAPLPSEGLIEFIQGEFPCDEVLFRSVKDPIYDFFKFNTIIYSAGIGIEEIELVSSFLKDYYIFSCHCARCGNNMVGYMHDGEAIVFPAKDYIPLVGLDSNMEMNARDSISIRAFWAAVDLAKNHYKKLRGDRL